MEYSTASNAELLEHMARDRKALVETIEFVGVEKADTIIYYVNMHPECKEYIIEYLSSHYNLQLVEKFEKSGLYDEVLPIKECAKKANENAQFIKDVVYAENPDIEKVCELLERMKVTEYVIKKNPEAAYRISKIITGKGDLWELTDQRQKIFDAVEIIDKLKDDELTFDYLKHYLEYNHELLKHLAANNPEVKQKIKKAWEEADKSAKERGYKNWEEYALRNQNSREVSKLSARLNKIFREEETDEKQANERKADLRKILSSEELDLYQLNACLDINAEDTADIVAENQTISARIKELCDDPRSFKIQTEIAQKIDKLGDELDMRKIWENTQGKVQKLNGNEVFDILTTKLENIEEYKAAGRLKDVLNAYYKQTAILSQCAPAADLYYCKCEDNTPLLDYLEDYKDKPVLNEIIKEKIARVFQKYSYHSEETKFGGFNPKDIQNYEKELIKELTGNPQSDKAKFYAENAAEVFRKNSALDCCFDTLAQMSPLLQKYYPETYRQLSAQLDNLEGMATNVFRRKFNESFAAAARKDPNSAVCRFYIDHVEQVYAGYCRYLTGTDLYLDMIENSVIILQDKAPDLCDEVCKYSAKVWHQNHYRGDFIERIWKAAMFDSSSRITKFYADNAKYVLDIEHKVGVYTDIAEDLPEEKNAADKALLDKLCSDLAQDPNFAGYVNKMRDERSDVWESHLEHTGIRLYQIYPHPELKSAIEKAFATREPRAEDLSFDYHVSQTTDLQGFDEAVDKILLSAEELQIKMCVDKQPITYTALQQKIREFGAQMPVKTIEGQGSTANGTPLKGEDLYEVLMECKPPHLHRIRDVYMKKEMAIPLMEKYRDLYVDDYRTNNEEVAKQNLTMVVILESKHPLHSAIVNGALDRYLQLLPEDERPTMADFTEKNQSYSNFEGKNGFEMLREVTGYTQYQQLVSLAADLSKDQKFKDEVALWSAAVNVDIVEHIKKLPAEKRPSIESLSAPVASYGKERNMWQIIEESHDNEKCVDIFKDILITLDLNEEKAKSLPQSEKMTAALDLWRNSRNIDQGNAAALAAFKAWQKSRGIKDE